MSTHDQGRRYEGIAARHLEARGWRILARNWRHGRGEVDLVALRERVLAFVEVKGRRGSDFGHPMEAITWRKRREVGRVARAWLGERGWQGATEVRFDAVAVLEKTGRIPTVEHLEDAWRD